MKRLRILTVGLPLAGMAFGLFMFGLMAAGDISYAATENWNFSPAFLSWLFNSIVLSLPHTTTHWIIVNGVKMGLFYGHEHAAMGTLGSGSFCIALVCFMALRRGKGIKIMLTEGILFFAAPVVMVFELFLMTFDFKEMYSHVTNFMPWMLYNHWYILSNSVVLFVSSCLSVIGLCYVIRRSNMVSIHKWYLTCLVVALSAFVLSILALVLYNIKTPPCELPPWPECWL